MSYKEITSITDIGGGVIGEQFNRALEEVKANLLDVATSAKAKRKIVLTITFAGNENRNVFEVEVKATTGLAPVKADTTSILLDNNVFVEQEKPQQLILDLGEATNE